MRAARALTGRPKAVAELSSAPTCLGGAAPGVGGGQPLAAPPLLAVPARRGNANT